MPMTTQEIMDLALEMVGFHEIPADSGIYVNGTDIERILLGIDMGSAEILLAQEMGYDCVVAHHPQPAIVTFPDIIDKHVNQMVAAGVPEEEAWRAVASLKERLQFSYHAGNYDHAPSVARLVGMPYMSIHNPLDELGRRRMAQAVEEHASGSEATLQDVVDALMTIPDFKDSPTRPEIRIGDPGAPAGKVMVSHAAGTNGGYEVARAYFAHGVDTVIYIHIAHPAYLKLKQEALGNLIVSGHITSDRAGITPFVEALREKGVEVTTISGV